MILSFAPVRPSIGPEDLLGLPAVAAVAQRLDGRLTVMVWSDGTGVSRDTVAAHLGVAPTQEAVRDAIALPEPSPLDWRVLHACLQLPRHETADLARLTGLSPKTATRHRDALRRSGALTIAPKLGILAGAGEVVYTSAIRGQVADGAVREHLGEVHVLGRMAAPPSRFVLACATDLADLSTRTNALSALPGVQSVDVTLNRVILVNEGMMLRRIDQRIGPQPIAQPIQISRGTGAMGSEGSEPTHRVTIQGGK